MHDRSLRSEAGAVGWLIVGVIAGAVLVIWLLVKVVGSVF